MRGDYLKELAEVLKAEADAKDALNRAQNERLLLEKRLELQLDLTPVAVPKKPKPRPKPVKTELEKFRENCAKLIRERQQQPGVCMLDLSLLDILDREEVSPDVASEYMGIPRDQMVRELQPGGRFLPGKSSNPKRGGKKTFNTQRLVEVILGDLLGIGDGETTEKQGGDLLADG